MNKHYAQEIKKFPLTPMLIHNINSALGRHSTLYRNSKLLNFFPNHNIRELENCILDPAGIIIEDKNNKPKSDDEDMPVLDDTDCDEEDSARQLRSASKRAEKEKKGSGSQDKSKHTNKKSQQDNMDETADSKESHSIKLLICGRCKSSIKNKQMPKFALQNRMWTGPIPDELQGLTWAGNGNAKRIKLTKFYS